MQTIESRKPRRLTLIQKIAYTVDEAASVSGVTKNAIREAVSVGELKSKVKGNRRIILATDLLDWLRK